MVGCIKLQKSYPKKAMKEETKQQRINNLAWDIIDACLHKSIIPEDLEKALILLLGILRSPRKKISIFELAEKESKEEIKKL